MSRLRLDSLLGTRFFCIAGQLVEIQSVNNREGARNRIRLDGLVLGCVLTVSGCSSSGGGYSGGSNGGGPIAFPVVARLRRQRCRRPQRCDGGNLERLGDESRRLQP